MFSIQSILYMDLLAFQAKNNNFINFLNIGQNDLNSSSKIPTFSLKFPLILGTFIFN